MYHELPVALIFYRLPPCSQWKSRYYSDSASQQDPSFRMSISPRTFSWTSRAVSGSNRLSRRATTAPSMTAGQHNRAPWTTWLQVSGTQGRRCTFGAPIKQHKQCTKRYFMEYYNLFNYCWSCRSDERHSRRYGRVLSQCNAEKCESLAIAR
jgi:hypothetical protein